MIWWGSGSKTLDLGLARHAECQTCGTARPYHVYCHYEYGHVYTIFRWVSSETYTYACSVCKTGITVDKAKAHDIMGDPIGAGSRYGCLISLGVLLLLWAVGGVVGKVTTQGVPPARGLGAAATPRVGLPDAVTEAEQVLYRKSDPASVQLVTDLGAIQSRSTTLLHEYTEIERKRAPSLALEASAQIEVQQIEDTVQPLVDRNNDISDQFDAIQGKKRVTRADQKVLRSLQREYQSNMKKIEGPWAKRKEIALRMAAMAPADQALVDRMLRIRIEMAELEKAYAGKIADLQKRLP